MENYVLAKPVVMLAAAIMLSIIVERVIEVLKSLIDYLTSKYYYEKVAKGEPGDDYWTRLACTIGKKLETHLDNAKAQAQSNSDRDKTEAQNKFNLVMAIASRYLSPAQSNQEGLFAISAEKIRKIHLKLIAKLLAIITGLILAWALNLDIIAMVKLSLKEIKTYETQFLGCLLTGIALGMGSGPMHKIIVALESRRKKRDEEDQ